MDYPVKTPQQLGAVLRGFRAARGLTQGDLGKKIGMAQNAISDFEREPSRSSLQRLYRVLSGLGLELVVRDSTTEVTVRGKRAGPRTEW